ncbi:MAG: hypothetical protein IH991_21420, partial [Planctomycetes bacterium]|nr:hypothetical protein [Planctomycetota bacterium]
TAEWKLPLGTIDDAFVREQFLEFAFSDDGQYLDLLWRKQLARRLFDNTQLLDRDSDQRASETTTPQRRSGVTCRLVMGSSGNARAT